MPRSAQDLTGQRFGRLVAVRIAPEQDRSHGIKYLCRCDCGKELYVAGWALTSGNNRSCGCLRREGNSKGFLRAAPPNLKPDVPWEVIGRADPPHNANHAAMWHVRCKLCGVERDLPYNYLGHDGTRCKCQGRRPYAKSGNRSPYNCKPRPPRAPSYHIWHYAKRDAYVVMDNKSKWIFTSKDKAKAEAYLEQLLQQQKED